MMAVNNIIQSVSGKLFSEAGSNVFAVLDGASVPNLLPALYQHQPEYVCLYRGDLTQDMAEAAPYLIQLDFDSELTKWIINQGWGKHWGIFAVSRASIRILRGHFRKFLMVYDPEGKPLYFRYYDPRVLRVYLPTCNAEELKTVFGPVQYFLFEDEDPNSALQFKSVSGVLQQDKMSLQRV
jgi:hypothetical protein